MGKKNGIEYYERYTDSDKCIFLNLADIKNQQEIFDRIDELKKQPYAKEIRVYGLKQEPFEYFIDNYGQQFKVIYFWKCPLISDFMILEQLTNVEYLLFYWNQRVTHLWDLSKNPHLKGISFYDFTRMHTLEEIPLAPVLEELYFGNMIWITYVVESLKPLCYAQKIKKLHFSPKKIIDNDITPLLKIKNLKELEFPYNLFTTEQIAWLTANLTNVKSSAFVPYIKFEDPVKDPVKNLDILVIGKRKPFLDSQKDKNRLEKYEKNFNNLVNKYRGEPNPP